MQVDISLKPEYKFLIICVWVASFVSSFHLPDTMDILDCMTDFSPQLLLIKHNLGKRDEMKETMI